MKLLLKIKLLLVLSVLSLAIYGQQYYTVTSDAETGPGSVTEIVITAAYYAMTNNVDVVVYFNAPGLCQISTNTQLKVNSVEKSITFMKHPSATVDQGLEVVQYKDKLYSFLTTGGFRLCDCSGSGTVNFDGLTFKGHNNYDWGEWDGAIMEDARGVTNWGTTINIQNCVFDNAYQIFFNHSTDKVTISDCTFKKTRIYARGTRNLYISNNTFEDCYDGLPATSQNPMIKVFSTSFEPYKFNLTIDNNTFTFNSTNASETAIDLYGIVENMTQSGVLIKENDFYNGYFGILTNLGDDGNNTIPFVTEIDSNNFYSVDRAICFDDSHEDGIITNNTFDDCGYAVHQRFDQGQGISFIESNSLGLTTVNQSNQVANSAGYSYSISNFSGDVETHYVNLDVSGSIRIYNTASIRECLIAGKNDLPIIATNTISSPELKTATFASSPNTLTITYELSNQLQSDADFILEFFESNTNGDLVAFLGSQSVSTLTGSTYTWTLSSSSAYTKGDRFAATITSLGNASNTAKGTSQAAYIKINCPEVEIQAPEKICTGEEAEFSYTQLNTIQPDQASWDFGDGQQSSSTTATNVFQEEGVFEITLQTSSSGSCDIASLQVEVSECLPCKDCIETFAPEQGEKYILSAWVKEDDHYGVLTYENAAIELHFEGSNEVLGPFTASGPIIDGWQKIYEEFTVPEASSTISVELVNQHATTGHYVYFDDIRIHPFNSNMKSFVYDPVSMKLVAELDENNYATRYEYDEEGALIRVKKETVRGVMTIQESFNNIVKDKN